MTNDQKQRVVREHGIGALGDALSKLPRVMENYKADAIVIVRCAVRQAAYAFMHDGTGTILLGFNRDMFTSEDLFGPDGIIAAVGLSPEIATAWERGQERKREAGQDVINIEGWMLIPPDGMATA